MLNYPRIVVFDDSLLTKALQELKPKPFKLFVYLYHSMENYEETGSSYEQDEEDVLMSSLGFTRHQLGNAFLELRRENWLDGLVLLYGDYGNEKAFYYRWFMVLDRDEYEGVGAHYIETREPYSKWNDDKYIIIGTEWVCGFEDVKQKKRGVSTKHWHGIRKQSLERDGGRCTECGSEESLHVHHLTYENEGKEKLSDVVTLCQPCHAKKPKRKRGVGDG